MSDAMSVTTHDRLKAEIETEYAPAEDNSFATDSETGVSSGYGSCYLTDPNVMPSC